MHFLARQWPQVKFCEFTVQCSITVDMPRKTRCIDDTLLWEETTEFAFWYMLDYITRCARNEIVFNLDKFQFAIDEVEFACLLRITDSIKLTKKMTNHSQLPNSHKHYRGQVLVGTSQPGLIRILTGQGYGSLPGIVMYIGSQVLLGHYPEQSKKNIIQKIEEGVKTFKMNKVTYLLTDYRKTGIRYFLFQKHCRCPTESSPNCGENHWKIILARSRFTKDAESRYSPVKGEALALIYGLESYRMLILVCPDLLVTVDLQPLMKIFSDQVLENIKKPHLFAFKERSWMHRFRIKHVPGKLTATPDCTSRHPTLSEHSGAMNIDTIQQIDRNIQALIIATYAHNSKLWAITWDRIVVAIATDKGCWMLATYV